MIVPRCIHAPVRCSARVTQVAKSSVVVKFEDVQEVLAELKPLVDRALRG